MTLELPMTKDETVKQLVLDLDQFVRRLPQTDRALMWHAVLTSLAIDMGAAYRGRAPSDLFDKVARTALMDVAETVAAGPNPGPVMTTTTPGEA